VKCVMLRDFSMKKTQVSFEFARKITATIGLEKGCTASFTIPGTDSSTTQFKIFQFKPMLLAACPYTSFGDLEKYQTRLEEIASDDLSFLDGRGDCFNEKGEEIETGDEILANLGPNVHFLKCTGQGSLKAVDLDTGCVVSLFGFYEKKLQERDGGDLTGAFKKYGSNSCLEIFADRIPMARNANDITPVTRRSETGGVIACFIRNQGLIGTFSYNNAHADRKAAEKGSVDRAYMHPHRICRVIALMQSDLE
jgi:hypothetical protein